MTPQRITLSRAKGWRKPEGTIIVSRPSIWGNPWGFGDPATLSALGGVYNVAAMTQDEAVETYRSWLQGRKPSYKLPDCLNEAGVYLVKDHLHARRQLIHANLHTLRGHDLACWCKQGTPCHADVLLEIANQ